MFKNLEAEMIRASINSEMVAKTIGKSYNSTRMKINGKKPFTVDEAMLIKKELFPAFSLDYLFAKDEEKAQC